MFSFSTGVAARERAIFTLPIPFCYCYLAVSVCCFYLTATVTAAVNRRHAREPHKFYKF
ncbi:hypothetical protein LJC08_05250 [Methanimicrococcus sp. OttesenSCG-928-J09]|nr:hypothetical protein [Methanimicrococcus sp. OttesenSCG-928-J09]